MSINKNFIVKNGLEVGSNLIVADETSGKVGVGTTPTSFTLEVKGGVGATDLVVTGVTTLSSLNVTGIATFGSAVITNVNSSGIITAAQFSTGSSGIGINTNTISGPEEIIIDPAVVGDETGTLKVKGNLTVEGGQVFVNNLDITDKTIGIAYTVSPDDSTADQAGFVVYGTTDKSFLYDDSGSEWSSSENIGVQTGKSYKIGGQEVVSSTTLGAGVTNSSLQKVGTLIDANVTGIVTAAGGFIGNVTGDVVGIASTARGLIGSPDLIVGVVTATAFYGSGIGLTEIPAGLGSKWKDSTTGINTSVDVGIGTTNPTSKLTVQGDAKISGVVTAATFYGDGSGLTGITGTGSGIEIRSNDAPLGIAATINFGSNLSVTPVSAGVATVSGLQPYWDSNDTGIHTTRSVGIGTTTVTSTLTVGGDVEVSGIITAVGGFSGTLTGDLVGTASTASFATTSYALAGSPNIDVSAVNATEVTVGILTANFLTVSSGGTINFNTDILQGEIRIGRGVGIGSTTNLTFGRFAGTATTDGTQNIAIGNSALNRLTTGFANVAIGNSALQRLGIGSANIAIGQRALSDVSLEGSQNIAIGYLAGRDLTASARGNVIIGSINPALAVASGFILAPPNPSGDNQLVIGNSDGIWIHGNENYQVGFGVTIPEYRVHVSGTVRADTFIGDGSGLTGVTAVGSGVIIQDDGELVGVATVINFGSNLDVSPIVSGVLTINSDNFWVSTGAGIHTTSKVGIGTTNPTSSLDVVGDTKLRDTLITGVTTVRSITADPATLEISAGFADAILKIERDEFGDNSEIQFLTQELGSATPEFIIGQTGDRRLRILDGSRTELFAIDPIGNVNISGIVTASEFSGISGNPPGKTIYVTTNGSDSNSGLTDSSAKASIKAAAAISVSGDTIKVLPGTYVENNPIVLPANVSIEGAELRNCLVSPQNSGQDLFQVNNGCHITDLSFVGGAATNGAAAVAFVPLLGVATDRFFDGARLIRLNLDFIAREAVGFVTSTNALNVDINAVKSYAGDLKYALKAICHDITRGGNSKCVGIAKTYPLFESNIGYTNELLTAAAGIARSCINNITWTGGYQSEFYQVKDLSIQADPDTGSNIDIGSCANVLSAVQTCAGIVTTIVGLGFTAAGITTNYPGNGGAISSGILTATASPSQGVGVVTKGPYIRNCTNFIPNSIGLKVNGFDAEPGDQDDIGVQGSMNVDSYTQYNQGGIGASITNGAYTQLVSFFTICDEIAVFTKGGGQCDITNSNSSFGTFGLVSDGVSDSTSESLYRSTGTATTNFAADSDTVIVSGVGSYRPYDGQVLYFDKLYFTVDTIEVTNGGSGYTDVPRVIIDAPTGPNGITAEAIARVSNGSVIAVDIISTGNQYLTGPGIAFTGGGGVGASATASLSPTYYKIESATKPHTGISTIVLTQGLNNVVAVGSTVFFSRLSLQIASSHSFEYIGAGNDIIGARPSQGGVTIQENEVVKRNGGEVVYTSTDQAGNFRIGDDVVINQLTGSISGRAFSQGLLNTVTPLIIALGK
jgi:hypothetical protein